MIVFWVAFNYSTAQKMGVNKITQIAPRFEEPFSTSFAKEKCFNGSKERLGKNYMKLCQLPPPQQTPLETEPRPPISRARAPVWRRCASFSHFQMNSFSHFPTQRAAVPKVSLQNTQQGSACFGGKREGLVAVKYSIYKRTQTHTHRCKTHT